MKIKRYFAPDIRQAMRMVRDDQGPDAVILSNRNVDGGVEIVAAKDFDEQIVAKQIDAIPATNPERNGKQATALRVKPKPPTPGNRTNSHLTEIAKPLPEAQIQPPANHHQPKSADTGTSFGAANKFKQGNLTVNRDPGSSSQIAELRKEIEQMRRVLDGHLSETTWMKACQENPTRIDLLRYLSNHGFSKSLSMTAAKTFGVDGDFDYARRHVQDFLASKILTSGSELLEFGGVVSLIGPTGVGKTTTIAKLAARYRMKHGADQVALISIDNERIGAHEQLATYGRILGVPVRSASSPDDLRQLLNGFVDRRLVLIDTAGMGQHDGRLERQLKYFESLENRVKTLLVISAATQLSVMRQVVSAFHCFQPQAHILTKLDETAHLGAALSLLIEDGRAVSFVTDGQNVPEDVQMANPQTLVEQCFQNENQITDRQWLGHEHFYYQDWLAQAHV